MKKYLSLLAIFMSGCVGMQMYKGAVIQYSHVDKKTDGTYSIEVLGHSDLNESDMVDLVKMKVRELCKSNDVIIKSYELGTYGSHTQYGSVYPPKINAMANCS